MNDLQIDYYNYKGWTTRRKRIQRAVGVLFAGVGITLFIYELRGDQSLAFTISAFCNVLLGITFFGQTYDLALFYPRNFIRITGEVVEYKLSSYRTAVSIEWNQIRGIKKNPGGFIFLLNDERKIRLRTRWLPSSDVKRIEPMLDTLASLKQIDIIKD